MKANAKKSFGDILFFGSLIPYIAVGHSVLVCYLAGRCHIVLILEAAAISHQGRFFFVCVITSLVPVGKFSFHFLPCSEESFPSAGIDSEF